MNNTNVYLLVLKKENEIVQMYDKVFTSQDFAQTLANELNDANQDTNQTGVWSVTDLVVDTFKSSNDLFLED